MPKYIVYFEPVELEARDIEDAYVKIDSGNCDIPTVNRVILAKYSFDVDEIKN